MQPVSTTFDNIAKGPVRQLAWQVRASFTKAFDDDIEFFTLDDSLLDGTDVLAPSGSSVIMPWDQYEYQDITDRIISVEVETEQTDPYSIVRAMADVTLNNFDDYFTPQAGSPIDQYILPRRPFRVLMGFGGEVVPLFVGLSTKMPEINKDSRTARFHCIDFLTFLFEQKIDNTVLLQDASTGEILEYLFDFMGLLPSQYDIDPTSFNRINYFYAEKGQTLGQIVRPLMEAEQGTLWLNELGVIRFKNRQSYPTVSSYSFDNSRVIDYDVSNEDSIINYVEIISSVLAEVAAQSLYQIAMPKQLMAGETVDIWIDFTDPVTSVTTPGSEPAPIENSYFIETEDQAGTTLTTDITMDNIDVFSKAAKITFTNIGSSTRFIYDLSLWGTPVKVIDEIKVEDFDQTSIDKFEQRPYRLVTNYIQERDDAVSKAGIMVEDYKDYGDTVTFEVKGNPALQIRDVITLNVDGYVGDFVINKIYNSMGGYGYTQRIRAVKRDITEYFILDDSLLDGGDVLSP